jgi:hypothetical protein
MKREGRLDVVWDVDFADGFVAGERVVDVAEHHVDLGVLKFQAEQLERRLHLFARDAQRPLRSASAARPRPSTVCGGWVCESRPGGGKDTDELHPRASVHGNCYP